MFFKRASNRVVESPRSGRRYRIVDKMKMMVNFVGFHGPRIVAVNTNEMICFCAFGTEDPNRV